MIHRCVQISETVSLLFLLLLSKLIPHIFAIQKSGEKFPPAMNSVLSFEEGALRKPNEMQRLSSKLGSQALLLLNFLQGHDFLVEKVSICVKIDFN